MANPRSIAGRINFRLLIINFDVEGLSRTIPPANAYSPLLLLAGFRSEVAVGAHRSESSLKVSLFTSLPSLNLSADCLKSFSLLSANFLS